MELTEEEIKEKDNRTDYIFKFKANANHKDNIGDAKMYLTFEVHGNYVSEIKSEMKIPEAWKREFYHGHPIVPFECSVY